MADAIVSRDPTRPDRVVAEVPIPGPEELEAALATAVEAQRGWRDSAPARSRALEGLAEAIAGRAAELGELIVREVGKPRAEADGEVARAVAILRYYAQAALDPIGELYPGSLPGSRVEVRREPLGVVLAICPWNFPLAIPIWKAAPALAYGNAVLIKPAAPASAVGAALAELIAAALPPGVASVVHLPGARAGDLLDDRRIAAATFTGSTEAGLAVAARLAARGAPAQAEMGGQNPAVVLEGADPRAAARLIVAGSMPFAGQKCTATRRVIAVGSIAGPLEEALAEEVESLVVGDPAAAETAVGPLIDDASRGRFEERVAGARERGARLIAAARSADGLPGHFAAPSVLAVDDPGDEVNQEETFGPLLTMLRVGDDAEAVTAANATRFGLVGAVHSTDVERAARVAAALDCGLQRVNAATPGVDYYAPFGGERLSSFGPREQGRAAREFFTATRTMTIVTP